MRALLVLCLSGCISQLAPPHGARITCENTSDCPRDYVCRESIGECVATEAVDGDPPTFGGRRPRIVPDVAAKDTRITVTLTANVPLASAPVLSFRDAAGVTHVPAVLSAQSDGDRYTLIISPNGNEPETTHTVLATMTDLAGNVANDLVVGTLRLDFTPPRLASTARTTAFTELRFDEPLQTAPVVALAVTDEATSLATLVDQLDALTFVYALNPGSLPEGPASLRVTATDDAGNTALLLVPSIQTLDFTAPQITAVTRLQPGAARAGSRIEVEIEVDEPLLATPELAVAAPLAFPCTTLGQTSNRYAFACTFAVGPSYVEGAYQLLAKLTDLAGNTQSRLLPTTIAVDLTPPAPARVNDPQCVVYARAPWGTRAKPAARFSVRGTSCATVPQSPPPTVVIYDGADPASATELGRVKANADGSFDTITLPPADLPRVYILLFDEAGNASGPLALPIRDVTFTAVLAPPHSAAAVDALANTLDQPTQHPLTHSLPVSAQAPPLWSLVASSTGINPPGRTGTAMAYDAARGRIVLFGGRDDKRVYGDTWEFDGRRWLQIANTGPAPRVDHALAYDAARGQVLMFGGAGYTTATTYGDTWAWDGSTWTPLAQSGPGTRYGHAMAYDPTRARVVLFGGVVSSAEVGDTWEWNGKTWAAHAATGPSPRQKLAMAFHPTLGLIVAYGGTGPSPPYNNMWAFDGSAWRSVSLLGSRPPTSTLAGMQFDPSSLRLMLLGDQTWEWYPVQTTPALVGQWTARGDIENSRLCSEIVFDGKNRRMVAFGGVASGSCDTPVAPLATTLLRSGTRWFDASQTLTAPPPSDKHVMVYDEAQQAGFGFGGSFADTWAYTGLSWSPQVSPANPPVPTRIRHTMSYDSRRKRVVMFGGVGGAACGGSRCSDLWEWGVFGLAHCATASSACWKPGAVGPTGRVGAAMAFDTVQSDTVLFGGECSASAPFDCNDTWAWDGNAWSQPASVNFAGTPPRLDRHAMVYDQDRKRTVLFGGRISGGSDSAQVWELGTGSACSSGLRCWQNVTPPSGPSARSSHTLIYDSARKRVILFGGIGAPSTLFDDAWEWDGTTWSQLSAANGPSPRFSHSMYYDAEARRSVLVDGSVQVGDVWELDADPATTPAIVVHFDLTSLSGASLTALDIDASARGEGFLVGSGAPGASVPGVTLQLWNARSGAWQALATNAAGASVAPISASVALPADGVRGNGLLSLAIRSTQGRGNGASLATTVLDVVELTAQARYP